MMIRLVMTNGETSHWVEMLGAPEYVLGRESSDLNLDDPRCSRRHAMLGSTPDGKLFIRDLESRNGTIVNKQKITEVELKANDVIRLGRTSLMVVEYSGTSDAGITKMSIRLTPVDEHQTLPQAIPVKAAAGSDVAPNVAPDRQLGSELLIGWPNGFRAMEKGVLEKFVSHLDPDQAKKSKRLIELLGKEDE